MLPAKKNINPRTRVALKVLVSFLDNFLHVTAIINPEVKLKGMVMKGILNNPSRIMKAIIEIIMIIKPLRVVMSDSFITQPPLNPPLKFRPINNHDDDCYEYSANHHY